MKVSVIIPCYNMERFVRRAVESCTLSSPSHEVEIVCVDDCSTDGTPKVLDEIASAAPNIKVVRHDVNKKLLEARRSGLAAATGDYIMHLDADDRFAPGTLDAVVERLGEDPVDCLFFGGRPVLEGRATEGGSGANPQLSFLTSLLTPPVGCRTREDLLNAMFVKSTHAWGVCGKVWRGDIARRCFDVIPRGPFMQAEDAVQSIVSMKFVRTVAVLDVAGYLYTADTGCMATDVLKCRNVDQRLQDVSMVQQSLKRLRQSLAPDDPYVRYLDAFERRVMRDFLLFCAPYLHMYRGAGLFDDGIKPEDLGMLALWWADLDCTQRLFRSTRWFWRIYRKWLHIRARLAGNEYMRGELNAFCDRARRLCKDETRIA